MAIRRTLWNAFTAAIASSSSRSSSISIGVSSRGPVGRVADDGVTLQELRLGCSDGTMLAAQCWRTAASPSSPSSSSSSSLSSSSSSSSSSSVTGDVSASTSITPEQQQQQQQRTIVCIHGWMDNCRSFYQLAPGLVRGNNQRRKNATNCKNDVDVDIDIDIVVIALDLPGHGRSSHKSIDAPPMVQSEMAYYVSEAIDCLLQKDGWMNNNKNNTTNNNNKITLVGHSLGAGIASLYASCFPEQIDQLILLDGAGFLARDAQDTSKHVRNHILKRQKYQEHQTKKKKKNNQRRTTEQQQRRGFPSLESAIARRLQSIQAMPGNQTLSKDTARELVLRATHLDDPQQQQQQYDDDDDDDTDKESSSESPEPSSSSSSTSPAVIQFRHDARFAWPSIQYMTQEQNEGIFQALGAGMRIGGHDDDGHGHGPDDDQHQHHKVDVGILLAENGWPFRPDHMDRALELIQPRMLKTLPGSHYFHADPETSPNVVDAILEFLATSSSSSPSSSRSSVHDTFSE